MGGNTQIPYWMDQNPDFNPEPFFFEETKPITDPPYYLTEVKTYKESLNWSRTALPDNSDFL